MFNFSPICFAKEISEEEEKIGKEMNEIMEKETEADSESAPEWCIIVCVDMVLFGLVEARSVLSRPAIVVRTMLYSLKTAERTTTFAGDRIPQTPSFLTRQIRS
jgi:hypothetical protein